MARTRVSNVAIIVLRILLGVDPRFAWPSNVVGLLRP